MDNKKAKDVFKEELSKWAGTHGGSMVGDEPWISTKDLVSKTYMKVIVKRIKKNLEDDDDGGDGKDDSNNKGDKEVETKEKRKKDNAVVYQFVNSDTNEALYEDYCHSDTNSYLTFDVSGGLIHVATGVYKTGYNALYLYRPKPAFEVQQPTPTDVIFPFVTNPAMGETAYENTSKDSSEEGTAATTNRTI